MIHMFLGSQLYAKVMPNFTYREEDVMELKPPSYTDEVVNTQFIYK